MKRVIVACGSGIATSQMVASKVGRLLRDKGISANVEAVDIKSIETHIKQADAYIAITAPTKEYAIPVFNGIAFLTGIDLDKELDRLIETISK